MRSRGHVRVLRHGWTGNGHRAADARTGTHRVRALGSAVPADRPGPDHHGHPAALRFVAARDRGHGGRDHRLVRRLVHRTAALVRSRLPGRLPAVADQGVRLHVPAHRRVPALRVRRRGLSGPGRGDARRAEPPGGPVPHLPADSLRDRSGHPLVRRVHHCRVRELADRADHRPDADGAPPGPVRRAALPDQDARFRADADQRVSRGTVRRPGRSCAMVAGRAPQPGAAWLRRTAWVRRPAWCTAHSLGTAACLVTAHSLGTGRILGTGPGASCLGGSSCPRRRGSSWWASWCSACCSGSGSA